MGVIFPGVIALGGGCSFGVIFRGVVFSGGSFPGLMSWGGVGFHGVLFQGVIVQGNRPDTDGNMGHKLIVLTSYGPKLSISWAF